MQEKLDQHNAWELDSKLERAMDALRTPPEDALIKNLSGGEKTTSSAMSLAIAATRMCCSSMNLLTTWMRNRYFG